MHRRPFLAALSLAALSLPASRLAHAEEPVVKAARIVEALKPKDIVLDRPGAPGVGAPGAPDAPGTALAPPAAIDLQVQFTFGSAQLVPQGKRQLDELAMALADRALLPAAFELAGHTDAVGGYAANMRLSLQRAQAVKDYLVQVHRVPAQRLLPIGFGFTRLADPMRPEAALNRRVEVRRLPARPTPVAQRPLGGRLVPTPR